MSENLNMLVHLISHIKEGEINHYKEKMNILKHLILKDPNNQTYTYRHRMVQSRLESLIETSKQLRYLELDIKNLKNKV